MAAPVDLDPLARRVVADVQPFLHARDQHVDLEIEPGLGLIEADSEKLSDMLTNLIVNAIKFSPPQSIIRVVVERGDHGVSILVRDQGPGIPESERHKLFKDFSQTSVKPTAGEQSTGLGLAICKRIMESHGGSITAESVPTGGSIFRITFPRTLLAA